MTTREINREIKDLTEWLEAFEACASRQLAEPYIWYLGDSYTRGEYDRKRRAVDAEIYELRKQSSLLKTQAA
jgi:hypothetical protein